MTIRGCFVKTMSVVALFTSIEDIFYFHTNSRDSFVGRGPLLLELQTPDSR